MPPQYARSSPIAGTLTGIPRYSPGSASRKETAVGSVKCGFFEWGEEGKEKCQQFRYKVYRSALPQKVMFAFGNLKICDICIVSRLVDHIENGMKAQYDLFWKTGQTSAKRRTKPSVSFPLCFEKHKNWSKKEEASRTAICQQQKEDSFSMFVHGGRSDQRAIVFSAVRNNCDNFAVPCSALGPGSSRSYRTASSSIFREQGTCVFFIFAPPSESVSVR